ncbi:hypothetical protein RND81_09G149000 [Saponaria officinalis]|uniref:Uncharacterized protein n=1 Tax=Saponaria officinalis TaxID=3572 RepID=A0AAW1IM10_SAPOF
MNGLELFSFLEGIVTPPTKTITTTPTPPSLTQHTPRGTVKIEQLILGALAGTLSFPIVALIVNDTTSHEAWSTLSRTFANSSRGHRLQIKYRLDNISHSDDMTIIT